VSAVSRSLHASAGQDAPTDAALPLALLRAQHATRQPHQPPAPYPQALLPAGAPRVSGARYRARLRLPEPLAAPQSGATRPPCYPLAPFVRAPHVRYPAGLAQRIDAIKSAPPSPPLPASSRPRRCWCRLSSPRAGAPGRPAPLSTPPSRSGPSTIPTVPASRRSPPPGRLWRPARTVCFRGRTAPIGRDRAGDRTQRRAGVGARAPPGSHVPPATVRRRGGGAPACLLGVGLRPAATRHGHGSSGGRTSAGVHLDPPRGAVLAGAHAVRGGRLSPGASAP
jgi:hypothetical protein